MHLACSFGPERNGVATLWALSNLLPPMENQTDSWFSMNDCRQQQLYTGKLIPFLPTRSFVRS